MSKKGIDEARDERVCMTQSWSRSVASALVQEERPEGGIGRVIGCLTRIISALLSTSITPLSAPEQIVFSREFELLTQGFHVSNVSSYQVLKAALYRA